MIKYMILLVISLFIACVTGTTRPSGTIEEHQPTQKSLVRARIATESAFNPKARSKAGCVGLVQLRPSTANYVHKRIFGTAVPADRLTDPYLNVALGTSYLLELVYEFKDIDKAIQAYNMGPGNIRRGKLNIKYLNKIKKLAGE